VWSERLTASIRRVFWNPQRTLFADDTSKTNYSEHAQCLAILSRCFEDLEEACFEALISAEDLARTTVYFSFYLLETYQKCGRGDLLVEKLDFWKDLMAQGFKTPVESPEPSRSDCHAWGSHPLFHMHASIMGVRPSSPGFASVEIAPQPGPLSEISTSTPHPLGWIEASLIKTDTGYSASIALPKGLKGTLRWKDSIFEIREGNQQFFIS